MNDNNDDMNKSLESLMRYSHLGLVMFLIMIAGWYLGTKVDQYYGTSPRWENVGFFIGLGSGFYYMFSEIFELRRQLHEDDEDDDMVDGS